MKNSSRAICALLAAILAASLFSCSEKKDDSAETSGTAETSGVTDTAADTAPAESSSPKYSLGLAADGKFDGIRASDHVKLCDYKGINIPAENCTASDEDIDARIKTVISNFRSTLKRTDRAVADGDTVNIDYVGSIDGVEFENGSTGGNGTDVTIGVTSYIDDFLEQLIGHMPGEEFDIEVMFPEQYHSADLAGKPAVFRIYLHKTEEKIVPELNDAFAAAVSEYNTLAEYKEYLRELEVQRREQAAKNAAMEQALQKAIANAQMEEYAATEEYEALVRDAEDQLIGRFEQDLQAQGITMDQYLSMTQETMEGLHRQVHPSAEQKVQAELVLEAVAETEGLDVTEEEVEIAVAQLAAQYQVNLAAMKNALDMDALRQNLRINKAASLIADSAVEIF